MKELQGAEEGQEQVVWVSAGEDEVVQVSAGEAEADHSPGNTEEGSLASGYNHRTIEETASQT